MIKKDKIKKFRRINKGYTHTPKGVTPKGGGYTHTPKGVTPKGGGFTHTPKGVTPKGGGFTHTPFFFKGVTPKGGGFTHTPTLVSLLKFFYIFCKKFYFFTGKKIKEVNRQSNKKTIPKLVWGYTIIETMISVSLFLVVIMSGMNALLNANLLFQKSQSARSILDSLNFVMDDISRNLRIGYDYQCFSAGNPVLSSATLGAPRSCASGWAIAFEASGGDPLSFSDQWTYHIADKHIFKSTDGANNFLQLTPDEVEIDSVFGFSVLGAEPPSVNNTQQPLVTIKLVGSITAKDITTPFSLQTSVSQRLLDI